MKVSNALYQPLQTNDITSFITNQIKLCEFEIAYLDKHKPFWFQKKKREDYDKQKTSLETRIQEHYKRLGEEYDLINLINKNK